MPSKLVPPEQGPQQPVASDQSGQLSTGDYLRLLAGTGIRVAAPMIGQAVGAVTPIPGAAEVLGGAGGGLGEYLAEKYIDPSLVNPKHEVNKGRVGMASAVGAVPGSWIGGSGKVISGLVRGGALGYGATAGNRYFGEHKTAEEALNPTKWSGTEILTGPVLGAATGGALNKLHQVLSPEVTTPGAPGKPLLEGQTANIETGPTGNKIYKVPEGANINKGKVTYNPDAKPATPKNPTPVEKAVTQDEATKAANAALSKSVIPVVKKAAATQKAGLAQAVQDTRPSITPANQPTGVSEVVQGTEPGARFAIPDPETAEGTLPVQPDTIVASESPEEPSAATEAALARTGNKRMAAAQLSRKKSTENALAKAENTADLQDTRTTEGGTNLPAIEKVQAKAEEAEAEAADAAAQQAEIDRRLQSGELQPSVGPIKVVTQGKSEIGEPQSQVTTYAEPTEEGGEGDDDEGGSDEDPHGQGFSSPREAKAAVKDFGGSARTHDVKYNPDTKQWEVINRAIGPAPSKVFDSPTPPPDATGEPPAAPPVDTTPTPKGWGPKPAQTAPTVNPDGSINLTLSSKPQAPPTEGLPPGLEGVVSTTPQAPAPPPVPPPATGLEGVVSGLPQEVPPPPPIQAPPVEGTPETAPPPSPEEPPPPAPIVPKPKAPKGGPKGGARVKSPKVEAFAEGADDPAMAAMVEKLAGGEDAPPAGMKFLDQIAPPPDTATPVNGTNLAGKAAKMTDIEGSSDALGDVLDRKYGEEGYGNVNPEGRGTLPAEPPAAVKDLSTGTNGTPEDVPADKPEVAAGKVAAQLTRVVKTAGAKNAKAVQGLVLGDMEAHLPAAQEASGIPDPGPLSPSKAAKNNTEWTTQSNPLAGTVEFQIPGDGSFRVQNNPAAIRVLMGKIKQEGQSLFSDVVGKGEPGTAPEEAVPATQASTQDTHLTNAKLFAQSRGQRATPAQVKKIAETYDPTELVEKLRAAGIQPAGSNIPPTPPSMEPPPTGGGAPERGAAPILARLKNAGEGYGNILAEKKAGDVGVEPARTFYGREAQAATKDAVAANPTLQEIAESGLPQRAKDVLLQRLVSQSGGINPVLAARLGLGAGGALVGAAANKDDRLKGAMIGAGVGAALPSLGGAASKINWKGVADQLPDIQRFNYLSDPNGLTANVVGAPTGLGTTTAIEKMLTGAFSGDRGLTQQGWNLLKGMRTIPTKWRSAVREASNTLADSPMNVGESLPIARATNKFQRGIATPATWITGAHMALRDVGMDPAVGMSEPEATEMALGNEPGESSGNKTLRTFGQGLQNMKATRDLEDKTVGNFIAKMLLPFNRTASNVMAATPTRTPGVGVLAKMMGQDISWPELAAQQVQGTGIAGGAYTLGRVLPPEDAKYVRKWVRNLGGRYGLVASAAFAAGQAAQAGKNQGLAAGQGFIEGTPMPTTEIPKDWLEAIVGNLSGKPTLPRSAVPSILQEKKDDNSNPLRIVPTNMMSGNSKYLR